MRVWECDRHFLVIVGPGGSQHVLRLGCSVLNLSNTIVGHFLSEIEDNNRDGFMKLACSSFCIKGTIPSWRMSRISFTGYRQDALTRVV
jgi:hypothetical protein